MRIFKHNSALNYPKVKKFHIRETKTNKKIHLEIEVILNLTGKIANFQKIQIFKCNSAPNHISVTKFHMKSEYLNTKNNFGQFLIYSGKVTNLKKSELSSITKKVSFAFLDHLL